MSGALALALASLALGAGELRLDAGVHLEGRGRVISPEDQPDDRTVEAVAVPRAAAELIFPDVRFSGTYAPRLRAPDLLDGADVVVLHAAELGASVRPHPAWRLSLTARGERGTTDLVTQARESDGELQTIPTTARLRYQAARGDAGLEGRIDPRTGLTVTAGAFVEGGEGSAAEATYPLQRGVRAEAALERTVTRRDRLVARLSALGAELDRGPTSAVVALDGLWRRRLARNVDGWLGAGAAAAYDEPPGGPSDTEVLPTAELGVAHTPPAPQPASGEEGAPARATPAPRIAGQAVVRLSPVIDRATGAVDPQVEAALRAQWPFRPRWEASAAAIGAVVRQSEGDSRRGRLEAALTWAARSWVRLGAGVYGSAQRSSSPALPSFDEYGVFVAVDVAAPSRQLNAR